MTAPDPIPDPACVLDGEILPGRRLALATKIRAAVRSERDAYAALPAVERRIIDRIADQVALMVFPKPTPTPKEQSR